MSWSNSVEPSHECQLSCTTDCWQFLHQRWPHHGSGHARIGVALYSSLSAKNDFSHLQHMITIARKSLRDTHLRQVMGTEKAANSNSVQIAYSSSVIPTCWLRRDVIA